MESISLTLVIVILTGLVSYQAFSRPDMIHLLKHWPYEEVRAKEWYRLVTCGFIHGSWTHLIVNMYVLYEFGRFIEQNYLSFFGETWGRIAYLALYLLTIIFANLPTLAKHKDNPGYASIGASGAVSGIIFIFILLNPWNILLLFFIIPVPAIILGIGYLVYSSWASRHSYDRIDHMAHFYGAVFGMLFTIALKPEIILIFLLRIQQLPFG